MSARPVPDDTLGIGYVDPARRRRRPSAFRRPQRTQSTRDANLTGLGGRRLALGLACVAGFLAIGDLVRYLWLLSFYPDILLPTLAWIVLGATVAGAIVAIRALSARLPDWLFVILAVGAAIAVWLDLAGTAGLLHLGVMPTAAPAAGVLLMPLAALRGGREVVLAAVLLAIVLAVPVLLQVQAAGLTAVTALLVAAAAAGFPGIVAVYLVQGFRRMVRSELDLVLVQSTVGTPPTAVGMHASEELARLDYDAETLLDDIGAGRIELPLPPAVASTAGGLATQLRIRLIEGRTDTWLKHAVTESEYLADAVTIEDRSGLAGLLSPVQRDSLLLAIWLLVSERHRSATAPLRIEIGPVRRHPDRPATHSVEFPIVLSVSGVQRRRVDPSAWNAIDRVGTREETVENGTLMVRLRCVAGSPADARAGGGR
jgi:hypothetical protein